MYNYIFWVVHYNSHFKESDKWISKFKATLALCFSIVVHVGLLIAIWKHFIDWSITSRFPTGSLFRNNFNSDGLFGFLVLFGRAN